MVWWWGDGGIGEGDLNYLLYLLYLYNYSYYATSSRIRRLEMLISVFFLWSLVLLQYIFDLWQGQKKINIRSRDYGKVCHRLITG